MFKINQTHNNVVLFATPKTRGWDSLHAASLCFGCPKPRRYVSVQRVKRAMKKILGVVPGIGFFLYFATSLEVLKISSLLGVLAISIAVGSVGYFHLNAPEGRRTQETAFGFTGKYKNPVYGTVIPGKVAAIIVSSIVSVCLLGLLFHHHGY